MRIVNAHLRVAASDVANFLACRHLTRLDLAAAHRLIVAPARYDIGAEALADRGLEHEARVLEGFRARGWKIEDLQTEERDPAQDADATAEAMRGGVDGIYQGTLLVEGRLGLPDFLVRADLLGSPVEGGPSYEVVDAKLARSAKARAVLQTTFYSALVGEVLGRVPEHMHLALGDQELHRLRVADYAAYCRQVGHLLGDFVSSGDAVFPPVDTYPEPVEHCAMCRWRTVCVQQRRADDDLSLIAGISTRQRKVLKLAGIATRRGFAALDPVPRFDHVSPESMAKAHVQARLQVEGEDRGCLLWEFVDLERTEDGALAANRGLTALPPPSPGDLFFDIEGARYYSEDNKEYGLQYLFGIVDTAEEDGDGRPRYHAFWSFDRHGEGTAFEALVDFISERRAQNPNLHVYHYNHYEPTALDHLSELHETREDIIGRLMGRFATREDEVDHLFRSRVFVDLYRVVRQGIRASIESYSLKRVEGLYGFRREVALKDVNERLLRFELALDDGLAADRVEDQRLIAGYNEDDCRSTLGLRDWLEDRRLDLAADLGEEIPRPVAPEEEAPDVDPEVEALLAALLAGIPDEERTPEHEARVLMADLLEWHRRDAKPGWWRHFRLHDLTDEELLGEPDAIAGLEFVDKVGEKKQSHILRYRFPPQEHPFRQGDQGVDPATDKSWTIDAVDDALGFLDLRRGRGNTSPHPSSLIEPGPIDTRSHRVRLRDLAARVAAIGGGNWGSGPEFDLLLRRRPAVGADEGASLQREGEETVDTGRRLAIALTDSHLPIQGPPGSGKTYTGAKQVIDLVAAGRKVGVTANSHAVIRNLLDEVWAQNELGRPILIGQRPDGAEVFGSSHAALYKQPATALAALQAGEAEVVGGTTWLWTREDFRDSVDVLVVDEAGQMSLANVLAAAHTAPNLILLGDPQQLGQPSAAAHPPGAGVSALERVLGDHLTMPDERGLFIEHTRRMHPDVCAFTSEVFYEGRLAALEELENQSVLGPGRFTGTGVRAVDVVHDGNDDSSPEEAGVIAALVAELSAQRWRNSKGEIDTIGVDGILVVTPFNAQIHEIEGALRAVGIVGARVGTVDKFQGQQAPVVIYSKASSTAEDAPRGMEFLYDLRRLNVATSRARCLAILVSSPELVRVFCRTPRQIVLANALCRFRELAEGHSPSPGHGLSQSTRLDDGGGGSRTVLIPRSSELKARRHLSSRPRRILRTSLRRVEDPMADEHWQPARLIPTSGISGQEEAERRASSALLAVMGAVREFGLAMVKPLGAPAGPILTYIEVPFKTGDERTCRPDGVVQTTRAGRTWTALVEVKTGAGELERPQVETYLDIARDNGFEAVLTISNQLAPAPGVHPVEVDRRKLRKVALYHLSWAEVLTIAVQQRVHRGVSDPDQAWILGELIRYLEYRGSGALDFSDMGANWVGVRETMAAGTLRPNDKGLADVLSRWEQLLRFGALRLGRELGADVQVVVSRKEAAEPALRIAAQAKSLVGAGQLSGSLRIPAAVAPLDIVADLRAGRVSIAVDVDAPREGRPATRVNWLVRQLKDAPEGLRIDAFAANSRTSTSALLRVVRENPVVLIDDPKRELRTFRIIATSPLGTKRGVGRGGFIDSVLAALDGFYGSVVQEVRPWTARAPQLPKGGRTAAEEAGLDITPPPDDLAEALEPSDEEVDGVPSEAPIPEPVLEGVRAVEDVDDEVERADGEVTRLEASAAVDDNVAGEELVSWSDAEDRLELERHLEESRDPSVPDAGEVGSESAPATLGTGLETSDPEEPEEWLAGGVGGDPVPADEERRPE